MACLELIVQCSGTHDFNDITAPEDEGQTEGHSSQKIETCLIEPPSGECIIL